MQPITHVIVTTVIVIVLWPYFGWLALAAYLTGVLVDSDHIFEYFKHHKQFSYSKLKQYYKTTNFQGILNVFHTIEFLVLLLFLSFYHEFFIILTISFIIHWAMDFLQQIQKGYLHHRKPSILWWIYKNRKKN
ncbi:MAG: hypothetical protein QF632_04715 [Candidatus Woesearchaeota archaeon]|jgi:hypothetical protein|nr:hypothetical protein [Candidatus Woesearchaeota archaeon]MDP7324035.1 hypothetical protein [Candidatus Woesearchaeota archaeon]MDP7457465.1 hypothetical protein [Candidatus Woesearchaeota archaeon]